MNNARKPGMAPRGLAAAIVLAVAVLLLLVGAIAVWRAVDPLTRQQAADRLARELVVTEATPLVLDVAIAVAWRALPIGGAVVGLAIAWQRWGSRQTLEDHYTAKQLAAQHQVHPQLQTLHTTVTPRGSPMLDRDALAGLLGGPLDVSPGAELQLPAPAPRGLADMVAQGLASPEQLYLGQGEDGQPQTIARARAGFICIAGIQGSGKSNTATLLASQTAAQDGIVYVIDPDAGDRESLATRLELVSGKLTIARSDAEIEALIASTAKLFGYRDRTPTRLHPPFLLLIDEFMRLALEQRLSEDAQRTLLVLSGDGRKKNMVVVPMAQVWKRGLVGTLGKAISDNGTHAIVHRSKPGAAELLLPGAYYARQAATLADGEAMLFGGGGEPVKTVVPELSQADLRYAAGGKPPAPYAPWPDAALRPAPLAPTERVAPARPVSIPTAPMSPPTIEEQIVELLRGRRDWLISAEIADALGVQKSTTLARLTELSGRGVIRQRPNTRGGRESYEYAAAPIAQTA